MAIKVSGTTVIDDSRGLSNITVVDATTAAAIGAAGVGGGSTLEATASGSLANGDTVVINSDGTVSVVGETTQTTGSPTVFESAACEDISATFDSNSNKVVIAYQDDGNSGKGTCVVGTVSGTSISFGTPVVFYNNDFAADISATFDSNSNKVVIFFRTYVTSSARPIYAIVGTVSGTSISFGSVVTVNGGSNSSAAYMSSTFDSNSNKVIVVWKNQLNSSYGTAKVGTVSGTSISFGTPVVFESATTNHLSATFDSNSNKVVITYSDGGNGGYGTAVVGTVSGTSISFGTPVVFESASTNHTSATFDSNSNKVVIAYSDGGNGGYGTAIVGTVSGTSISFGSPVVFESASSAPISATYDTDAEKVVIAYIDNANSLYGTLVVGTVSGTSISFGSPVVFESAATDNISATFDSTSNKVVIGYRDEGNSNYGTGIVFQNDSTTATRYIGISDGAYSNGQTATIQLVGSVDDAQSGLTAGTKYYVQADGSLGASPAEKEVYAGIAVSSTNLIVKG